jgi:hypothetical protein
VLRETTSRGLCGLGCPSRTSERGGEGDCVKEGGGGEGKCNCTGPYDKFFKEYCLLPICVIFKKKNTKNYIILKKKHKESKKKNAHKISYTEIAKITQKMTKIIYRARYFGTGYTPSIEEFFQKFKKFENGNINPGPCDLRLFPTVPDCSRCCLLLFATWFCC